MTKFNARPITSQEQRRAALERDLKAADDNVHNRKGGGALPSTKGWGQHKIDRARITLAPIWRKTMTTQLILHLDGEGAFPDVKHAKLIHLGNGAQPIRVALLEHGMASGRPSVAIRLDLHDGTVIVAETSARLFCAAGRAIVAKHPDLFEGD